MITIIDYEMGNLRSVQKAFEKIGTNATITQNPDVIKKSNKIVLPGVGAMAPAIQRLKELNMIDAIKDAIKSGKPFLGICLGLQLLFEKSDEGGNVQGLGILKGTVERLQAPKVPHMGWNQISLKQKQCALFKRIENMANVYFCHSYVVRPAEKNIIATSTGYGDDFASSVCQNNLFGVQFHPEKSQTTGLQILKNFTEV